MGANGSYSMSANLRTAAWTCLKAMHPALATVFAGRPVQPVVIV